MGMWDIYVSNHGDGWTLKISINFPCRDPHLGGSASCRGERSISEPLPAWHWEIPSFLYVQIYMFIHIYIYVYTYIYTQYISYILMYIKWRVIPQFSRPTHAGEEWHLSCIELENTWVQKLQNVGCFLTWLWIKNGVPTDARHPSCCQAESRLLPSCIIPFAVYDSRFSW